MKYTDEHKAFLRENRSIPRKDLVTLFNQHFGTSVSYDNIHSACSRFKIRSDSNTRFQPGQKSWNTGTKGLTGANRGSFKKGQTPLNTKPVGHERVNRDGYIEIKTQEPSKFELKHRVVWRTHHGELSAGTVVTFKDGNRLNCAIDNLKTMSKQELVRLNQLKYSTSPKEVQPTLKLIAQLRVQTARIKKEGASHASK